MADEHWVFAYGSLMWNPQVPIAESVVARVDGYARRFCLRSICHRGTAERPGLVLGLDPDTSAHCMGVALRVSGPDWPETLERIREREMVTEAYAEAMVTLRLQDGRRVQALAYVMRHDHWQYAGDLAAAEQADIIARAQGGRGPNADYLFNTVAHLAELGLPDQTLDQLAEQVRTILLARLPTDDPVHT